MHTHHQDDSQTHTVQEECECVLCGMLLSSIHYEVFIRAMQNTQERQFESVYAQIHTTRAQFSNDIHVNDLYQCRPQVIPYNTAHQWPHPSIISCIA